MADASSDPDPVPDPGRRRFLRAGSTAAAVLAAGACAGTGVAAAADGGDYGGWFGSATGGATDNYDGTTVDKTGQDTVTVEVGAKGNGGTYAFSPPAVRVSPGTKVVFKWVSNTHNIRIQDQPSGANWQGESQIENEGYTYSHTFDTAGTYKYYCQPHLALGMKGVIVVGGGGGGGASTPDWGDWFTANAKGGAAANYDGTTVDKTGQDSVTIDVGAKGNGGTYAFSPPAVKIDPGTTVTFRWVSNTHNVVVESQPSGANWPGESDVKDEGFTYSYTFGTSGTYTYYCQPHLALGMKGGVFVTGNSTGGGGGGGGGGTPLNWWNLAWMVGPSLVAIPSVVAYLLWGAWRDGAFDDLVGPSEYPETAEAPRREPENPLSHDEYDPWGTATLIAAYLAIIALAWTLMYFVEFLGHGPHILG